MARRLQWIHLLLCFFERMTPNFPEIAENTCQTILPSPLKFTPILGIVGHGIKLAPQRDTFMAAFKINNEVWMSASLLPNELAVAGQVDLSACLMHTAKLSLVSLLVS